MTAPVMDLKGCFAGRPTFRMDAPIRIHAIVGMEDAEMMKLDRLRALATLARCVMAFALSACAQDNHRAALVDNFVPPVGDSLREALDGDNTYPCAAPIALNIASDGTINRTANAAGDRVLPIFAKPDSISMDGASGGQGNRHTGRTLVSAGSLSFSVCGGRAIWSSRTYPETLAVRQENLS